MHDASNASKYDTYLMRLQQPTRGGYECHCPHLLTTLFYIQFRFNITLKIKCTIIFSVNRDNEVHHVNTSGIVQSSIGRIISNIGLKQLTSYKIKIYKMVTENKVLPFNQQEENNENTFFVKIFKGMGRFAKVYDIMTVFFY